MKAPRLKPGDSAPNMGALIQDETPSMQTVQQKSQSFNGFPADFDGDTQVMPSQIYKDHVSMRISMTGDGYDTYTNGTVVTADGAQMTLQDGDTGHIDLMQHWSDNNEPEGHTVWDDEDSLLESQDHTQFLLSSINRPSFPKTPGTAGHKRNYRGQTIPSTTSTKTPGSEGYSAFRNIAPERPGLSLTQMFEGTQERSSPQQDAPMSDPVFMRPSPNFRHSSPVLTTSSPTKKGQAASRGFTEPRDTYTSMKESQERRKQQKLEEELGRERLRTRVAESDGDEEEEDSEQLKLMRRLHHNTMKNQALQDWGNVRAPSRPGSRSKTGVVNDSRAEAKRMLRTEDDVVDISDDGSGSTDDGSVDVYDEFAQDVIPSQRQSSAYRDATPDEEYEHDDDHEPEHEHFSPEASPSPTRSVPAVLAEPPLRTEVQGSAPRSGEFAPRGAGSGFAVADSQPENRDVHPPRRVEPSSMSSMVPGSQYPGVPSQKVAGSGSGNGIDKERSSQAQNISQGAVGAVPHKVPSSPPVLAPVDGKDGHDEDAVEKDVQAEEDEAESESDNEESVSKHGNSSPLPLEAVESAISNATSPAAYKMAKPASQPHRASIPETDPSDDHQSSNNRRASATDASTMAPPRNSGLEAGAQPTNSSTALYETAATHLSNPLSARLQQLSQTNSSNQASESPRKAAGIRTFGDIATDPTPPDAIKDIDIDFDIMTADDHDFMDAISSPAKTNNKRQRVYGKASKSSLRKKQPEPGGVQHHPPIEPSEQANSAVVVERADEQAPGSSPPSRPTQKRRKVQLADPVPVVAPNTAEKETNSEESAAFGADQQQHEPLTENGNVANKQTRGTPSPIKIPHSTPPSVRKREEAGARKIALLLAKRKAKESESNHTRSGRLARPSLKARDSKSENQRRTSRTTKRAHTPREIAETPQSKPYPDRSSPDELQALATNLPGRQTDAAPQADPTDDVEMAEAQISEALSTEVISPMRVLALFKGALNAYYPATCLGTSTVEGFKLRVRFDDGTVTLLEPHHVCRLQLQPGDQTKVDLNKMRSKAYTVTGFANPFNHEKAEQYPKTDIYGNLTAILTPKQRDSLPGIPPPNSGEAVHVPITSVYVTQSMWINFANRRYTHTDTSAHATHLRISTPSTNPSIPTTPASRSRRKNSLLDQVMTTRTIRADSSTPSIPANPTGVFAGMAFAVSYISHTAEKDSIMDLIQRHGGQVLETGFEQLFSVPDLPDPATPAPQRTSVTPANINEDADADAHTADLSLTPAARSLGFVALIADRHSRRAKYIQALALSLPCLSGRWILDSVARGAPLPWPKYLLPAGESAYLGGATRSRTLEGYEVGGARLVETMRGRARLLADGEGAGVDGHGDAEGTGGGGVLLVVSGGQKKWVQRKTYAFLTFALGAARVRRVGSLAAAKEALVLEEGRWKWVFVDGRVEEAEKVLFGGVKRKREDEISGSGSGRGKETKMVAMKDGVRVVADEFVVQSLILGALVEE